MIDMVWVCIKWIVAAGLALVVLVIAGYVVLGLFSVLGKLLSAPATMWKDAKETGTTRQTAGLLIMAAFCIVIAVVYLVTS
ncbi:hypothetical protein [Enterobacter ludwigii]|uniref:hypothetical protein n=1 Tax=Enterobacter ludwigii TaxID=299767 RepID=UPI003975CDC3